MKRLVLSLALACSLSTIATAEEFESLGDHEISNDDVLVFGGSFSPPTLEHMGILARLMYRYGFGQAKMIVAFPYKKGAVPAEVSLGLTQTAVTHMDEVLDENSIPFENIHSDQPGRIRFDGKSGRSMQVQVDDFDIREQNRENTLKTLEYLRSSDVQGNAKKLFWISGGDSFVSVPTWMKNWEDLFAATNWIVVNRPGIQGAGQLEFNKKDPLRGLFPDEFLSRYTYRFDDSTRTHIYQHSDPSKPGIYIIDQPMLDDSSSKNRASLKEVGDHAHAQGGLQPSVFIESVKNGYYGESPGAEGGYTVFTQKNLENFLRHFRRKIEWARKKTDLRPDEIESFREMSKVLVKVLSDSAVIKGSKPQLKKWLSSLRNFLAFEIMQPLEARRVRRRASGDSKTFQILSDFRDQLLRGNPNAIVSRVSIDLPLGLLGEPSVINLIKSRLPRWIPHRIRKMDDLRVTWYDLNISTNELQAFVKNPELVKKLQASAGSDKGLFADLLLTRVLSDAEARPLFEAFLSYRYIRQILDRDTPPELLGGFSERERAAFETLLPEARALRRTLSPSVRDRVIRNIAASYAIARVLTLNPDLREQHERWTELLNLIIREYPGQSPSDAQRREVRLMAQSLSVTLPKLVSSERIRSVRMNYEGSCLADFVTPGLREVPPIAFRSPSEKLEADLAFNASTQFVESQRRALAPDPNASASLEITALPTLSRGEDVNENNAAWEMEKYLTHSARRLSKLNEGLERAFVRLSVQPHSPDIRKIVRNAQDFIRKDFARQTRRLQSLQFRWILEKKKFHHGLEQVDESKLLGFGDMQREFQDIRRDFRDGLSKFERINHLLLGSESLDLTNESKVRERISSILGRPKLAATLGQSSARRIASRCGEALLRILR